MMMLDDDADARPQAVYASTNMAVGWTPGREVLLGVLSSDARVAVRALRDWCQALGLPYAVPECKVRRRALPGACQLAARPWSPAGSCCSAGCGAAAAGAAACPLVGSLTPPLRWAAHRLQVAGAASLAAVQGAVYIKYNSQSQASCCSVQAVPALLAPPWLPSQ
jgi:hypothetical protein